MPSHESIRTIRPELQRLIVEYQRRVSEACRLLRERLPFDGNLLKARMHREVPQKGWLDDSQSVSYSFHGIGCHVRFGSVDVDFDFGPGGRHDGFDAWRLAKFAETFEGFEQFHDTDKLGAELESLERGGMLVRFGTRLDGHLYYFADAEE